MNMVAQEAPVRLCPEATLIAFPWTGVSSQSVLILNRLNLKYLTGQADIKVEWPNIKECKENRN